MPTLPLSQPRTLTLPSSLTFASKTILVTGCTPGGLGYSAAKLLLIHHTSTLVITARSQSSADSIASILLNEPLVKALPTRPTIIPLPLDLDHPSAIPAFTTALTNSVTDLDAAILNAGRGGPTYTQSPDTRHEAILQVNVYSSLLNALDLLPLLRRTAARKNTPSRLTWVGSFVQFDHEFSKTNLPPLGDGPNDSLIAHLDQKKTFGPTSRYNTSRLLSTMLTRELAARVPKEEVIINDLSPGMVATNFGTKHGLLFRVVSAVAMKVTRSRAPDEGAKTYLWAIGECGEESHGAYLVDNAISERTPFVESAEGKTIQKKIWDEVFTECVTTDPSLKTVFD
ncbi:hypothetical protein MMC20_006936 [Loxospora ochrophaea]|nr:hypothetical protein [Loxospora ochrophaea]